MLHGPGPIWTGTEWTDRTDRDRDFCGPSSVGRSGEVMMVGRSVRSIHDEIVGRTATNRPGPTGPTDEA